MSRDNDRWIADLAAPREAAVADLRNALLRNLRKALSHRMGVDEAFLEDAVQEALLRILQRLDQFEGRSRFLTWATSIAIRIAFGELRRRRWKDVSLDELLADAEISPQFAVAAQFSQAVQAEHSAVLVAMRDVIERELTAKQRTALLAELKGMPQDEIARRLASNRNAIYKLTHDARKKLKRGLEAAGYTSEDVALIRPA